MKTTSLKLTPAQQKFLSTIGANWAECFSNELVTANALLKRGLVEICNIRDDKSF